MEILEDRLQKNPIVITTQYPLGKWQAQLPDPTFADAICDRFKSVGFHFNLGGDSMRIPQTRKEYLIPAMN